MKKIIAALVVLAIAAPALATSITATQISGTEVKISYDASGDPNLVRAFGFDATLDNGGTFDDTNDTSASYPIFPGSINIDAFGNVLASGTPVGSDADHPDTQGGLGTGGVTIEMGSLYAAGESAPATSGDLLVLEVNVPFIGGTVGDDANLAMADNAARGGIVLEGGGSGSSYTGVKVYYSTLNRAQYAKWLAWGGGNPANAPQNWRNACWLCGDVTGDGFVTFGDVSATFNYFKDATSNGEGDINMDGFETFGDVTTMFSLFKSGPGCGSPGCP